MAKPKQANGINKLELPLANLPNSHPCNECGQCCTYVAVEIDEPTGFDDYDNIFWYLTHRGVSVYIDWEGDWFIEFETVCENLSEAKTCAIYEDRPKMCSDFSWDECEKTTKEKAYKSRFSNPDGFFHFMETRRPRAYERYLKHRDKMQRKRQAPPPKPKPAPEARV